MHNNNNGNQKDGYQPLNDNTGHEMQKNNGNAQVNANNHTALDLKFRPYLTQPRIVSNMNHPATTGGQFGAMMEALDGVFIKEKTDWMEAVGGCESNNVYSIKPISNDNGITLFRAREDSGCCARNFMAASTRPFNMYIRNEYTQENTILLERDYSLPVLCLFRPVIKVYEILRGLKNHEIGYVTNSYACCTVVFDIYDHRDQLIYKMSTEWCQRGIQCKCPFDSCKQVEFIITDPRGREVTRAKREGRGFAKNVATDSD